LNELEHIYLLDVFNVSTCRA